MAGYGALVMLSDPVAVKDVFRGDPQALHSGEGNEFASTIVGTNSVLVLDEEPHARQRRVLLPPFKGERMRSFFEAIQTATLDEVRAWPVGRPIRMLEPMQRITVRVILQAVLGLPPGPRLAGFEAQVRRLLAITRSRYSLIFVKLPLIGLLRKARWLPLFRPIHDLDESIFAYIAERRRLPVAERGENVLADLLATSHEDGKPLGDQEIRDAVLTMLLAGHDTTAVALSWTLEQVVPRGDVVERIADELSRATGGGPPQVDQLNQLTYLDAVIREGLRFRTILPFVVRLTKQVFRAGGRNYPPGILLCPCNHLVHRRPDLYPEPDAFRPDRFLTRHYAANEWFPFGGGGRMCVGMAFALYEMKVVLSTLFATVRLTRPPGSRSVAVRRGIALAPDDGAVMTVVTHYAEPGAATSSGAFG